MSDISNKFVVVTITNEDAKVWATGTEKGSKPEKIHVPERHKHLHIKNGFYISIHLINLRLI